MIKKIVKILSIAFLISILLVLYLSIVGIKTDKFNNIIINNILKINQNINLNLNKVNYLLNPFNFTVNVITKNPQILLQNKKLEKRNIKTNVLLKSLIKEEFAVDNLQIETKEVKLKDILEAKDNGYSFFWESIFILHKKNYKISEIPINLPSRLTGNSKMRIKDIFHALLYLFYVSFKKKNKKFRSFIL